MNWKFYTSLAFVCGYLNCFAQLPTILVDNSDRLGEYYDYFRTACELLDDGTPINIVANRGIGTDDFEEACRRGASTHIFTELAYESGGTFYMFESSGKHYILTKRGHKKIFGPEVPMRFFEGNPVDVLQGNQNPLDLLYISYTADDFKSQYPLLRQIALAQDKFSKRGLILLDRISDSPMPTKAPLCEKFLKARGWKLINEGNKKIYSKG